ncbi:hypothetical protein MATL_G00038910 [Megalops atlanticus]|uniref:Polyprenal reductase n=1 Tax=Megalops atlanticus TaxID=7932 RepID=A0A9D3TGS8_MEGAT|nr:hypothetical protein MATL_G00038910 [Megalops atlanticus]
MAEVSVQVESEEVCLQPTSEGITCEHLRILKRFSRCPPEAARSHAFHVFQDLIRYGKTKNLQRPSVLCVFDVPKRWFSHFYAVSVLWNGLLIALSLRSVVLGQELPVWLNETLRFLTAGSRSAAQGVSASAVLVQVLLWTHSLRRLWECVWVSVFSDGVIHAVQYVFGLGYYVILGLTVLCADALHPQTGGPASSLLSQLRWFHAAGVLLFLWASLHQHRCLRVLAQLRMGNSGELVTLGHKVPHGGWFEVVSCPHYFAELLIYVSLSITCRGGALTWWLVVLYVFFNQALAAQLCHEFYCSRFQSYPQQRKAFVPFLL